MLEDIPRHGSPLAEKLRSVGEGVKNSLAKALAELYPSDTSGCLPIAYLWARTISCEAPNCGAEIPLARAFWLCSKADRRRTLRYKIIRPKGRPPRVEFEIFEPKTEKEVPGGTVRRAKATCLACGMVLPPERVRAQLAEQRGGADVTFDQRGNRIGGARMLTVVIVKPGEQGRRYRLANEHDYRAVWESQRRLNEILRKWERGGRQGLCPVPDEPTPAGGGSGAGRAFSVQKYGMMRFGDLFTARQKVGLATLGSLVRNLADRENSDVCELMAVVASRCADYNSALARWAVSGEFVGNTFGRQALPPGWDWCETVLLSEESGGLSRRSGVGREGSEHLRLRQAFDWTG